MSKGGYDPRQLNFEQLNAMMQVFMQERELMFRCHRSFLAQASQMEMPADVSDLISEYSRLINETLAVAISSVEKILENDIGAPPQGRTPVTTAAARKNDRFEDDLYEAFSDIDTEVHDLRTLGWIMNCTADPSEGPPQGIYPADLGYFLAKLVARQAERIGKITGAAQEQLRERRQASR